MLSNGNGTAPFALTRGFALNPGDSVDTRGGGQVVIELSDGSMVVVQPESVVVLKDYRAAGSLRELFEITLGRVRVKINHFGGRPNPYRMNSPTASIAVRGTEFSVMVDAQGDTQVEVYEGAVEVTSLSDPNRRALIEAGRGVLVRPGQDLRLFAPPPGSRDIGDRGAAAIGDRDRRTFAAANAPPGMRPENRRRGKSTAGCRLRSRIGHPEVRAQGMPGPPGPPGQKPNNVDNHAQPRGERGSELAARHGRHLRALYRRSGGNRPNALPAALQCLSGSASGQPGKSGIRVRLYQGRGAPFLFAVVQRGRRLSAEHGVSVRRPAAVELQRFAAVLAVLAGTRARDSWWAAASQRSRVGSDVQGSKREYQRFLYQQFLVRLAGGGAPIRARRPTAVSGWRSRNCLAAVRSTNTTVRYSEARDRPSTDILHSHSDISQTRLTAGCHHDFAGDHKLGVFYRYGLIGATDADRSHTDGGVNLPLDSTRSAGHSAEIGARLRGPLSRKLFYGLDASHGGLIA